MAVRDFVQLREAARKVGPTTIAIAAASDVEVVAAARGVQDQGIARCLLVGDQAAVEKAARVADVGIGDMEILDVGDPRSAARMVMELVREGRARVAVKGKVDTPEFLRAALDPRAGLVTGALLTHVGVFEVPGLDRLILISDGGVVLYPTMEQKVEIIQNAIQVAHKLGVVEPKVALLAAVSEVNPNLPITVEAAGLARMEKRWRALGAVVDGPITLDAAMSSSVAKLDGLESPVAGAADVLIAPDVEAGNIMAKGVTYFAKGRMAGIVTGARVPLVVGSRADLHETRVVSIALGVVLAA